MFRSDICILAKITCTDTACISGLSVLLYIVLSRPTVTLVSATCNLSLQFCHGSCWACPTVHRRLWSSFHAITSRLSSVVMVPSCYTSSSLHTCFLLSLLSVMTTSCLPVSAYVKASHRFKSNLLKHKSGIYNGYDCKNEIKILQCMFSCTTCAFNCCCCFWSYFLTYMWRQVHCCHLV